MGELRRAVRAGEPAVGNWVSIADPAVAEVSAELGFDFVTVDVEHTTASLSGVESMARAVDAGGGQTETLVRLPENDPVWVKRVLDIGVGGVMVPMVDSAAEAEAFVESTRYPPEGVRGVAAGRAARYGLDFPESVETANEEHLTVAQIESEAGLADVEAIAAVDGLDALFVGPADLSAALDAFAEWDGDALADAIERVLETDLPVGTLALSGADIDRWIEAGFDFLIAGTDMGHVVEGSRSAMERARTAFEEREG